MKTKVSVKEKLTVYIYDKDGKLLKTKVVKPPKNKLEEIAARLGILKRANSVNALGMNTLAKLWVGEPADPIKFLAALRSDDDQWIFRSGTANVITSTAYFNNAIDPWAYLGIEEYFKSLGAATTNHEDWIVSEVNWLDLSIESGYYWAEIRYDFTT